MWIIFLDSSENWKVYIYKSYILDFPGGTVVKNPPALVWEDPTCHEATKPVHHSY